eukprot:scaffold3.g6635.t1
MQPASLVSAAESPPPPAPVASSPARPGAALPSTPSDPSPDDGAVDAVFLWVNTSDPRWRAAAANYSEPGWQQEASRGEVVMSLAAVAHYMPWLRHIWVVSMQQRFDLGLYTEEVRRKVSFVDHADIVPAANRPLFNSLAIELFLHNIPGLAERFVYLNDDMLMAAPLERRDAFSPSSGRFKAPMLNWGLLHLPAGRAIPEGGFYHMYNNVKLLLDSAKLGPVPKYGWHAGYFVTTEAWRLAWRLFGEQLAVAARHRRRIYAPLDQGGDINTPASARWRCAAGRVGGGRAGQRQDSRRAQRRAEGHAACPPAPHPTLKQMLMSLLGIMSGLQEVDTGYRFRMLESVPPNLHELLTAGASPPPAAGARRAAAPPAAAPRPGDRKSRGPDKVLFLNFQALAAAPADAFQRWCREVLAVHEAVFARDKHGCLCASPVAVGMAC